MTFRTFYDVKYETPTGIEEVTAENYEIQEDMFVFDYYPEINHITNDIINLKPTTKHILKSDLIEITERSIRF